MRDANNLMATGQSSHLHSAGMEHGTQTEWQVSNYGLRGAAILHILGVSQLHHSRFEGMGDQQVSTRFEEAIWTLNQEQRNKKHRNVLEDWSLTQLPGSRLFWHHVHLSLALCSNMVFVMKKHDCHKVQHLKVFLPISPLQVTVMLPTLALRSPKFLVRTPSNILTKISKKVEYSEQILSRRLVPEPTRFVKMNQTIVDTSQPHA